MTRPAGAVTRPPRRLFARIRGAVEHWRADRHRWQVIDSILADLGVRR